MNTEETQRMVGAYLKKKKTVLHQNGKPKRNE